MAGLGFPGFFRFGRQGGLWQRLLALRALRAETTDGSSFLKAETAEGGFFLKAETDGHD